MQASGSTNRGVVHCRRQQAPSQCAGETATPHAGFQALAGWEPTEIDGRNRAVSVGSVGESGTIAAPKSSAQGGAQGGGQAGGRGAGGGGGR